MTPFPDVEKAVCDLLTDLATAGTATMANLQESLPYLRVVRYGGGDDVITDTARVDVDAFQATRATALALAEAVRARLLDGPHLVNGVTLDLARTDVGPHEVPWDDPNVRRFTAAYRISARRAH